MPELPEVEFARRRLEKWLKKHAVVSAHAENTRIFRGGGKAAFDALRGKVKHIDRHGKQLLLVFESGRIRAHLGMTGKWVHTKAREEKHSRAHFELADGSFVHYKDPRMFGLIEPTEETALESDTPDALGITAKQLQAAMGKTKLPIKVALMDQARIAGIGNIQASEALYRAKISPFRSTAQITEWAALAKGINDSLKHTLKSQKGDVITYVEEGGDVENPFLVYERKGERCKRCQKPFATKVQAGRTTYYCPGCQKR